jgi:hypothetical protein
MLNNGNGFSVQGVRATALFWFKDAEDVILQALKSSEKEAQGSDEKRREAIDRLMAFGKTHGLSLGGMTIRELRDEARP